MNSWISTAVRTFLIGIIKNVRPFIGPRGCCKFTLRCSRYAIIQLEELPIHKALWAILKRFCACSPFSGF